VAPLLGQLCLGLPALARERVALGAQGLELLEPDSRQRHLLLAAHERLLRFLDGVPLDLGLETGVLGLLRGDELLRHQHRRALRVPLGLLPAGPCSPQAGLGLAKRRGSLLDLERGLALDHPELAVGGDQLLGQRVDLLLRRPHALALRLVVQRREELPLADRLPLVRVQPHDPR
jgi:hypothetical protein